MMSLSASSPGSLYGPVRPDCHRRRQRRAGLRASAPRITARAWRSSSPGRLGGTCVNVGCVPKKIMWNARRSADALHDCGRLRLSADRPRATTGRLLKPKRDAYVQRLNGHLRATSPSAGSSSSQGARASSAQLIHVRRARALAPAHRDRHRRPAARSEHPGRAARHHLGRLFRARRAAASASRSPAAAISRSSWPASSRRSGRRSRSSARPGVLDSSIHARADAL